MKKCITALLLLFTLSVTSLLACTSADKPESATGKTSKTSKWWNCGIVIRGFSAVFRGYNRIY